MTRVDFYSLAADSRGDRFLLACRLVARIYDQGLRLYLQVPDAREAEHLDRLLWTFQEQSFLPHGRLGRTDPALTPILIGDDPGQVEECPVLINLGLEVPAAFPRFARLCEPIDLDSEWRRAGRERFRYYRNQGCELHHHEIRL